RRSARSAVQVELASQQPDALAHRDEPEAAAARRVREGVGDVEAAAVVLDRQLEAVAGGDELDPDVPRAGVAADVRERALQDPQDRDPLRARRVLEVARDPGLGLDL